MSEFGNSRSDAMRELREKVESCPNIDDSCFGSNPGALIELAYFDDAPIRATFNNIASVAHKAGRNGTPLEEATFKRVGLRAEGAFTDVQVMGLVADTTETPVPTEVDAPSGEGRISTKELEVQIGACAYVCAQADNCPLFAE